MSIEWVVERSCTITLFCRNCREPEWRHVDGKCLFSSTSFAYEDRAEIAKRIVEERYVGWPATQRTMEEMAAFLRQTLLDLERDNL